MLGINVRNKAGGLGPSVRSQCSVRVEPLLCCLLGSMPYSSSSLWQDPGSLLSPPCPGIQVHATLPSCTMWVLECVGQTQILMLMQQALLLTEPSLQSQFLLLFFKISFHCQIFQHPTSKLLWKKQMPDCVRA